MRVYLVMVQMPGAWVVGSVHSTSRAAHGYARAHNKAGTPAKVQIWLVDPFDTDTVKEKRS